MPYIGNTTSDFSIDTGNITNRAVTATKLSPSSVGSNGQVLSVDGSGNLQWGNDANAPEGTAVLSTGESGTTKFLRVDGDGTCSWQVPPNTQLSFSNDANNRVVTGTGSGLNGEANLTYDGTDFTQKVNSSTAYSSTATPQKGFQIHNEDDTTNSFSALRLTSGSSSPATAQISSIRTGTGQNDLAFQLETSNTAFEALRITSTGKVGIGTTSPTNKLQVNDTNPVIAEFYHSDGGTNDEARIALGAYSSNPPSQRGVTLVGRNTGAGHDFVVNTSSSHSLGPTEKLKITSDGQLKFNQTQSKINNNTSDGSDNRYLSINGGGDASQTRGAGITFYGNEVGSNEGRLWIGAGNSGSANGFISFNTAGAEAIRIDSDGRLLIGTTAEGDSSADDLTIATTGNTGITIRSGVNHSGNIYFSDATSGTAEYKGYVQYDQQNDNLKLGCDSETVVWLHADKKLSVGYDSTGFGQWAFLNIGSSGADATGGDQGLCIRSDTGFTNNSVLSNTDFTLKLNNNAYAGTGVSGSQGTVVKLLFNGATSNGWNAYGALGLDVQGTSGGKGDLFFNTGGTTDGNERMRIKYTGNVGIGTTSPGNKLHVAGITQIENGASNTQGDAQLFIRKGSGTAAPESITRTNSYLHLGGTEWGPNAAGVYTLSFGYTNGTTGTNVPAYIGFKETSTSSYTKGDLVFGVKEGTNDVAPTEKLCIKSNGSINFSNTTIATKNTAGDITIDFGNLTDNGGNAWRKCGVWIMYNGIDTDATDNKSVIYYTGIGSVTTWNWVGDTDTLSNDGFNSVTLQNAAATSFRLYCDVNNQNTGSVTVLIHAYNTKPTITIN